MSVDTRTVKVTAPDREKAAERGLAALTSSFPNLVVGDLGDVVGLDEPSQWLVTAEVRPREIEDSAADLEETPRAPSPAQLKRLERLSKEVLGDGQWIFGILGYPATHAEAQLTLSALGRIANNETPDPGPETNLVNRIREKAKLPAPPPDDEPPEPDSEVPTPSEASQRCSRCREEKPLSEFPPNPRTKSGRDYRCSTCTGKPAPDKTATRRVRRSDPTSTVNQSKVAASVATPAPPETPAALNGAWRQVFANPTLEKLEALQAFLDLASLDDAARISRLIGSLVGASFEPKDAP